MHDGLVKVDFALSVLATAPASINTASPLRHPPDGAHL
jgi:hypothetical protein